jgi:hypothetical protein
MIFEKKQGEQFRPGRRFSAGMQARRHRAQLSRRRNRAIQQRGPHMMAALRMTNEQADSGTAHTPG